MAHTTKIEGAKGRGYTAHCLDCDWVRLSQGPDDRRRIAELDCIEHHIVSRRGEAYRAHEAGEITTKELDTCLAVVDAKLGAIRRDPATQAWGRQP